MGILLAIGAIALSVATLGVGAAVLVAATGVAAAVSAGVDVAMEPGATGGDIVMAAGLSAGIAAPLAMANPAIAATSAVTSIVGSLAGYGISQDRTGWHAMKTMCPVMEYFGSVRIDHIATHTDSIGSYMLLRVVSRYGGNEALIVYESEDKQEVYRLVRVSSVRQE
ncbi:MAG: hypothetical protein MPJ50_18815 [Pirellulales bacterium]|nr:hypothetical protein [Pirellulales bacterium]